MPPSSDQNARGWGGRHVSDEDWNKKHYFVCVNQQCRHEWYTDDPLDYNCPKCGLERCAESWHPRKFDETMNRTNRNHSDRELDLMLLRAYEARLASLKRNGPNFWEGERRWENHREDIKDLKGKIQELRIRLQ